MRWNYYKLRQVSLLQSAMDSYVKVRHGLLQVATGITKCRMCSVWMYDDRLFLV